MRPTDSGSFFSFTVGKKTLLFVLIWRSIHLFSPLMEVGQYHVYLTAHAQNVVQRIFALPTNARTHSLIYDYY